MRVTNVFSDLTINVRSNVVRFVDGIVRSVYKSVAPAVMRALLFAVVVVTTNANAQEWPVRPVTVVHPYGNGGGDAIARLVLDKVSERLGQNFVLKYQPGASGIIGSDSVVRATPDGYTLLDSALGSIVVAPYFDTAPYDPLKSFTHIALFGGPPIVLFVKSSNQVKTLEDFIAFSRKSNDGIGYGTLGRGAVTHLAGELLRRQSGAQLFDVGYKGAPQMISDVLGGHLGAGVLTLAAVSSFAQSRMVRILGISSEQRSTEFPDVPTFAEKGYKNLVANVWFGLSGPARLPRSIVEKLNKEVRAVLALPDIGPVLAREGVHPNDLDADAYTRFVGNELERWGPIARELASANR